MPSEVNRLIEEQYQMATSRLHVLADLKRDEGRQGPIGQLPK